MNTRRTGECRPVTLGTKGVFPQRTVPLICLPGSRSGGEDRWPDQGFSFRQAWRIAVRGQLPVWSRVVSFVGADCSAAMVQQPPAALLDRGLARRPDIGAVAESANETCDDPLPSADDKSMAGGSVTPNPGRHHAPTRRCRCGASSR